MRVLYGKMPPKSRVKKYGISGTCFTLRWENIGRAAQMFRRQWLKGVSPKSQQYGEDVEFGVVHVTDENVTFYFKEIEHDVAETKSPKRKGKRANTR